MLTIEQIKEAQQTLNHQPVSTEDRQIQPLSDEDEKQLLDEMMKLQEEMY